MEGKLAITRHFFKVMMPGFQEKLDLPPAFCKRIKEENSEEAVLKSRKGTWKINVCRNREGVIRFKDGWPQFVHHHSLTIGDFLVFEHTGVLHFNVFVFDPTACEKEFVVVPKEEHEEALSPSYHPKNMTRSRGPDKELVISYHSQNPYFVVTMQTFHNDYMNVPVEFVRSNNLVKKTGITLRDPQKRAWPVKILFQRNRQFRVRMGRGWHDFYISNELKNGDVCVFDLNPGSRRSTTILFDVQIFPAPQ